MTTQQHNGKQRGVAIIEFALMLPMLLVLMMIVTELGRAIMDFGTLVKSVRDAARYLSVQTPGTKITEAKNLVVYGNPAGSGSPLVPGLTTANVPDPTWSATGSAPVITVVTIKITGFEFQPLVANAFGWVTFGPFTFSDIQAAMRSHL
jgi:Flp pilus assembly protein TadG